MSEKGKLIVKVKTATNKWAGTDDIIWIRFFGTNSISDEERLDNHNVDDFEHGTTSKFTLYWGDNAFPVDPGDIYAISLRIEPKSGSDVDAILLEEITIERYTSRNSKRAPDHYKFPLENLLLGDRLDGSSRFESPYDLHRVFALVDIGVPHNQKFSFDEVEREPFSSQKVTTQVNNKTDRDSNPSDDIIEFSVDLQDALESYKSRNNSEALTLTAGVNGSFMDIGASFEASNTQVTETSEGSTQSGSQGKSVTYTGSIDLSVPARMVRIAMISVDVKAKIISKYLGGHNIALVDPTNLEFKINKDYRNASNFAELAKDKFVQKWFGQSSAKDTERLLNNVPKHPTSEITG
ncbi:MAG: PLAT/LH2 domain-containing protein [Pseudomonadota bacterium]